MEKICKDCNKTLKLICKRKIPLYYLFMHVHAELDIEIYECESCGLRSAFVPEQVFRETIENKKEGEELIKDVSIL